MTSSFFVTFRICFLNEVTTCLQKRVCNLIAMPYGYSNSRDYGYDHDDANNTGNWDHQYQKVWQNQNFSNDNQKDPQHQTCHSFAGCHKLFSKSHRTNPFFPDIISPLFSFTSNFKRQL